MRDISFFWLSIASALFLGACGRRLPPGVEPAFVASLVAFADATAPKCAELMNHPCFQGDRSAEDAGRPSVPQPVSLIADPRVRYFGAYCTDEGSRARIETDCSSQTTNRPPKDRERCSIREFKTGRVVNQREPGDYVLVADGATCDHPWISVVNVRRTREGLRFLARTNLLPAVYLDAHPALNAPSADRPQ